MKLCNLFENVSMGATGAASIAGVVAPIGFAPMTRFDGSTTPNKPLVQTKGVAWHKVDYNPNKTTSNTKKKAKKRSSRKNKKGITNG